MTLSSFLEEGVFSSCQHFINDPSQSRLINKTFPHIFIITLNEECTTIRRAHTKRVLDRLGANFTFCYMNRPTEAAYKEYCDYYETFSEREKNSPVSWKPGFICVKLKKSELGVIASHSWILSHITDKDLAIPVSSSTKSRMHLIFEDDILAIKDFERHLSAFLTTYPTYPQTARLWMLASLDWKMTQRGPVPKTGYYMPYDINQFITGAGGYAVNPEYAVVLRDQMRTLKKCADQYFIFEFDKNKDFKYGCVMYPPLFMTDFSTSTNDNVMDKKGLERLQSLCYPTLNLNIYDMMRFQYLEHPLFCDALQMASLTGNDFINVLEKIIKIEKHPDIPYFLDIMRNSSWSSSEFIEFLKEIEIT